MKRLKHAVVMVVTLSVGYATISPVLAKDNEKLMPIYPTVTVGRDNGGTFYARVVYYSDEDCNERLVILRKKNRQLVVVGEGTHIEYTDRWLKVDNDWFSIYRKVTVARVKGIGMVEVLSNYYLDEECTKPVAVG